MSEILYRLRTTRGLSQQHLARTLGLSPSYLSLLERGKRPETIEVARRLANWLGIAPGLLLLETLDPQSLESGPRALVEEVQREFQQAFSSGDFTGLQRMLDQ